MPDKASAQNSYSVNRPCGPLRPGTARNCALAWNPTPHPITAYCKGKKYEKSA